MQDWNKLRVDPPDVKFRIRNALTGCYIHETLFRIMEFPTRKDALMYIISHNLNRDIYYTEVVV